MILKHDRFMDVAFFTHSKMVVNGGIQYSGVWINMGQTSSWIINENLQTILIKDIDKKYWKMSIGPSKQCIRYNNWEYL